MSHVLFKWLRPDAATLQPLDRRFLDGFGSSLRNYRNATADSCRRAATCIPQNPSTWDLRPRLSLVVALRLSALRKSIATG